VRAGDEMKSSLLSHEHKMAFLSKTWMMLKCHLQAQENEREKKSFIPFIHTMNDD
jgi:hypothetical protein